MAFPIWVVGVLLAALGSIISNFGLNLQKYAHVQIAREVEEENRSRIHEAVGSDGTLPGEEAFYQSPVLVRAEEKTLAPVGHSAARPIVRAGRSGSHSRSSRQPRAHSVDEHFDPSAEAAKMFLERASIRAQSFRRMINSLFHRGTERQQVGLGDLHLNRSASGGPDHRTEIVEERPQTSRDDSVVEVRPRSHTDGGMQPLRNDAPLDASDGMVTDTDTTQRSRFETPGDNLLADDVSEVTDISIIVPPIAEDSGTLVEGVGEVQLGSVRDKAYTKRADWRVGISFVVLGSLFDFAALAFAAQSIVAPLGSMTLVSNVFFAKMLLGERVTRRDVLCTLLILGGSALAVAFASHEEEKYEFEQLFDFFTRTRFIVYSIVLGGVMLALFLGVVALDKMQLRLEFLRNYRDRNEALCAAFGDSGAAGSKRDGSRPGAAAGDGAGMLGTRRERKVEEACSSPLLAGSSDSSSSGGNTLRYGSLASTEEEVGPGLFGSATVPPAAPPAPPQGKYAVLAEDMDDVGSVSSGGTVGKALEEGEDSTLDPKELMAELDELESKYAKVRPVHRFMLPCLAGIMGAQSVLFAKCTAEMLSSTIRGDGILFAHFQSYLVLIGLGVTIFLQIKWLNGALRFFKALHVVPVFQSFWTLVSVIGGMVFFGEYQQVLTQLPNGAMFPAGIALVLVGIYFLSQREEVDVNDLLQRFEDDLSGSPAVSRGDRAVSVNGSRAGISVNGNAGIEGFY